MKKLSLSIGLVASKVRFLFLLNLDILIHKQAFHTLACILNVLHLVLQLGEAEVYAVEIKVTAENFGATGSIGTTTAEYE